MLVDGDLSPHSSECLEVSLYISDDWCSAQAGKDDALNHDSSPIGRSYGLVAHLPIEFDILAARSLNYNSIQSNDVMDTIAHSIYRERVRNPERSAFTCAPAPPA